MKSVFNIIFFVLFPMTVWSGGDHGETGVAAARFGPGRAIEDFDKEEGFKLSERAMNTLGVRFQKLVGSGPWLVPQSALVHIKQSSALYRRYDGWISLVLIKVLKEEGPHVLVKSDDLEAGDEVAIAGSSYLRMTDSDLNAGTVDSCSH